MHTKDFTLKRIILDLQSMSTFVFVQHYLGIIQSRFGQPFIMNSSNPFPHNRYSRYILLPWCLTMCSIQYYFSPTISTNKGCDDVPSRVSIVELWTLDVLYKYFLEYLVCIYSDQFFTLLNIAPQTWAYTFSTYYIKVNTQ